MFESSDPMRLDLNDNSDEDDYYDFRLNKLVLSFLRLKQMDQFTKGLQDGHKKPLKKKHPKNLEDELMDFEEDKHQALNELLFYGVEKSPWLAVWNKITAELNELKRENHQEYLKNNTNILGLHIKHSINLDSKCFNVLISCLDPRLIENVFDKGLIDSRDTLHLSCVFDRQLLFNNLHVGMYNSRANEPCKILACLTVLLYKSKCFKSRLKIVDSMNKKLTVFINREQYSKKFRQIFIRHFIRAVYLNGLLSYSNLKDFLSNTNRNYGQGREERVVESDSDEDDISDDEDTEDSDIDDDESDHSTISDSSDTDNEQRRNAANRIQNQNAPQNEQPKSVGKLINFTSTETYKSSFPLSLKNICRIKIKNSLKELTQNSVNKLYILPNVMRDFLLFREEIDHVIKLCKDNGATEEQHTSQSTRARAALNDLRVFV